jgi:hypothetical protein
LKIANHFLWKDLLDVADADIDELALIPFGVVDGGAFFAFPLWG